MQVFLIFFLLYSSLASSQVSSTDYDSIYSAVEVDAVSEQEKSSSDIAVEIYVTGDAILANTKCIVNAKIVHVTPDHIPTKKTSPQHSTRLRSIKLSKNTAKPTHKLSLLKSRFKLNGLENDASFSIQQVNLGWALSVATAQLDFEDSNQLWLLLFFGFSFVLFFFCTDGFSRGYAEAIKVRPPPFLF